MTTREQIVSEINILNETQLKQVADYLEFLKLRQKDKNVNGNSKKDSIFNLGRNPVDCDAPDASENLDKYLY